jgi:Domain of unknown function (DUF4113)
MRIHLIGAGKMKRRTPHYTTDWAEIPIARA